ncbi:MAG: MCP four helix bundle domain-containing protein, partial [Desulfitobacterium hafniense]
MKAIANLKVSTKLVMSFCLLALITFAVGGLGVFNTLRLQEMDQELYTYQTLPLLELRVIHGSFEENRAYIRDIILEEDPAQIETHLKAIEQNRQIIDQALATFGQSLRTEEETLQFTYLDNVLENFDYHLDQVMELCRHGNKTFAYTVLAQDGPKLSANFSAAIDNLSLIKEQTGHEVAAA